MKRIRRTLTENKVKGNNEDVSLGFEKWIILSNHCKIDSKTLKRSESNFSPNKNGCSRPWVGAFKERVTFRERV